MGFFAAIKTCFQKYFEFSGRASRSEFWFFILFYIIVSSALAGADGDILHMIILIPLLAVTVRRFHDIGKSGWWILWFFLISFILGSVGAGLSESSEIGGLLVMVSLLGVFIWEIVWLTSVGDADENLYGANPLESTD